ncbi:hypothetical protein NDU88_003014 [Pleurodeles waltl]|uniref:Tick transposon n=1 Tax=Pleurodeles waltl TaxID=8319 RepID=A0AAV7PCK7_PLEWA|nr:hypothetical protein NDU88_003014 [Pleurodeles waltl]
MPVGKAADKSTGRPARQLLFSKALQYKRPVSPAVGPNLSSLPVLPPTMSDKEQLTTIDRILQEITAISRRVEGMDASISSLTLKTKSMRSEIAGFQSRVTGLEHRMRTLESSMTTVQDRDQDLLYLRSKITDLEDVSRRDNISLFGFPENEEGPDVQAFLSSVLPKMTSLTFDPPLECQRAQSVGPKRPDGASRPRPIIVCLLRHGQASDYSKDTNECQKAFLALRPRLLHQEMKYGLFDPVRILVAVSMCAGPAMGKSTQQCPGATLATGKSDTDGETLGSNQGFEAEDGGALKLKGEETRGAAGFGRWTEQTA